MDARVVTRFVVAAVLLALGPALVGCAPDAGTLAVTTEAITGGPVRADSSDDAVSRARRDAVVRARPPFSMRAMMGGNGCGAVLLTPRIVATVAHCNLPDRVAFGAAMPPDFDTQPHADVIACVAHPGALSPAPSGCDDPRLSPRSWS